MSYTLLALLLGQALAGSPSGLGTPVAGGMLASPGSGGPLELVLSPAAAGADRALLAVDLGLLRSSVSTTLSGEKELRSGGLSPIPTLAATFPLGERLGLGLLFVVPFARSSGGPEDGPQRFHSIEGGITVLEGDVAVALRAHPALTVGIAGRVASASLGSRRAIDTGGMVAELMNVEDKGSLLGDPLLEGRLDTSGQHGVVGGFAVGVDLHASERWGLLAWYRSTLWGSASGDLSMVPSQDLGAEITGRIRTELRLPAEAGGALPLHFGRVRIVPQLSWIDWSSWALLHSEASELEASSRDPALDDRLDPYGLTSESLLSGLGDLRSKNDTRDVFSGGLELGARVAKAGSVRGALLYSSAAIPNQTAHPANLDFATTDLRLGVDWQQGERTRFALSVDAILATPRHVDDSALSLEKPASSGLAQPSGNGDYRASIGRLGLTVEQRLGGGSRARPAGRAGGAPRR